MACNGRSQVGNFDWDASARVADLLLRAESLENFKQNSQRMRGVDTVFTVSNGDERSSSSLGLFPELNYLR